MKPAAKQVYFIKPVGMDGPIKIGCSKWPEHRLVDLSIWSPFPLEIIASGEGSHELERFIHRMFAESRSHKEWFHATPDLVARILRVQAGMDIVAAFGAVAYFSKGKYPSTQPKYRPAMAEAA